MQLTLSADLTAHPFRWSAAVDGEWLSDAPTETSASLTFPDLDPADLDSARFVAVWLEDGEDCALLARRPRSAKGQDRDAVEVQLPETRAELSVFDPRLSTEYDAAGQPRRFGIELWLGEDPEGEQRPWRLAGEAVTAGGPDAGGEPGAADTGDGPPIIDTPAGLTVAPQPGAPGMRIVPMSAHASGASGLALYVLVSR